MIKRIVSRLAGIKKNTLAVFEDKDRKALFQIIKEFLDSSLKTNCVATYYFTSLLYKKDIHNYLDFLSHHEWQELQRAICDSETYDILSNKLFFQNFFESAKIPVPSLVAYNNREKFSVNDVSGWQTYEILNRDDLRCIMQQILSLSSHSSIFTKPMKESGGTGATRICGEQPLRTEQMNIIYKNLLSGAYLFQDEVIQHKDLAVLNPTSLNTVRIDTFKMPGKIANVISASLRIGRAGSFVDNLASGGLRVGINLEEGTLKEFGTTKLGAGGLRTPAHPDTGLIFKDFIVPHFGDVKNLVIEAANWLPTSLIGWDVAITENGVVLIEGNSVYYATQGSDIAYGGYRKNPVYQEVVNYVRNDLKNRHSKKANIISRT